MTAEHTTRIAAPPAEVWQVTLDVDRWPGWAPTVTAARRLDAGPFRVGSQARIKQPGQPEATWTVTELVEGRRFTWETARWGLRMYATHEIAPDGDGTLNTLRVETDGALATLLGALLRPLIRRALTDENRGLKAHCEGPPSRGRGRTVAIIEADGVKGSLPIRPNSAKDQPAPHRPSRKKKGAFRSQPEGA